MKKEHWTSIGLFIFALITLYESVKLGIWEHRSPTAGTFPAMLGALLAILSFLFFIRYTFKFKKSEETVLDDLRSHWVEEPDSVVETSKVEWRKVVLSMVAIGAYPFLFMKGGYIIGTAVFLLFMCKVSEQLKILTSVVITLVTIIASYALFGILLKVPLF